MQPKDEKDSSPLEDKEITRLIKVSREIGYKKQDKIPERNLVDFKPISITEIAASPDDQKIKDTSVGSGTSNSPDKEQDKNLDKDIKDPDKNSSDQMAKSNLVEMEHESQSGIEQKDIKDPSDNPSMPSLENPKNSSTPDNINQEENSTDQDPKSNSAVNITAEKKLVKESSIPSTQNEGYKVDEARQEGIEIGKKIAFTDFENKQQQVLETFEIIIDNIKKKEAVDKTDLTQAILKAVTRLASERAGKIIDEYPEPFKNKIISFAEKIEQESKKLVLNLNPVDAKLLKESLEGSLSDKEIEIRGNSELFRGDFIFQMGAVEIGDLISEQISILEKEQDSAIRNDNPLTNEDKVGQNQVDSDEAEATPKIGQENKEKIDNARK